MRELFAVNAEGAAQATEVEITWIRHALSCANVNDNYSDPRKRRSLATPLSSVASLPVVHSVHKLGQKILTKATNALMLDPPLSDVGVASSVASGQSMRAKGLEYDFIGASNLLRAVETASATF